MYTSSISKGNFIMSNQTKTIRYADSVYKGETKSGEMNGQGKLVWNDGGEWVGEFKEGLRWNGHGIHRFDSGAYYDGTLKEGKRSGFGRFVWSDGSTHEGEWVNDKRHGHGKMVCKNGDILEGIFVNDCIYDGTRYLKRENKTELYSDGHLKKSLSGQYNPDVFVREYNQLGKVAGNIFLISTIITAVIFLFLIHIYKANYPAYKFNEPFNFYTSIPIIVPIVLFAVSNFVLILGYLFRTRTIIPCVIMLFIFLALLIIFVPYDGLSDLEIYNQIRNVGLWTLRSEWAITSAWLFISIFSNY